MSTPANTKGVTAVYAVSWFKKYLDEDVRYDPWVCGALKATAGSTFAEVRDNCP